MRQLVSSATMTSVMTLAAGRKHDFTPKITSSIIVEGLTRAAHTIDEKGVFKHPFLNSAPEIQTIYYSENGSFSTKLHRVKDSSFQRGNFQKIEYSFWENIAEFLFWDYKGARYDNRLTNINNLKYLGQVLIGTPL